MAGLAAGQGRLGCQCAWCGLARAAARLAHAWPWGLCPGPVSGIPGAPGLHARPGREEWTHRAPPYSAQEAQGAWSQRHFGVAWWADSGTRQGWGQGPQATA